MAWRYLLAVALSLAVIILYPRLFPPAPRPERPPRDDGSREAPVAVIDAPSPGTVGPVRVEWEDDLSSLRSLAIEVPEQGELGGTRVVELVRAPEALPGPLALAVRPAGEAGGWEEHLVSEWARADEDGGGGDRVHRAEVLDGALVITLTALPQSAARRHLEVRLGFENRGDEDLSVEYRLYGAAGLEPLDEDGSDVFLAWATRKGEEIDADARPVSSIGEEDWSAGDPLWVGAFNARFLVALYPQSIGGRAPPAVARARARFAKAPEGSARESTTSLESAPFDVTTGGAIEHAYGLFAGPRDRETLRAYAAYGFSEACVFRVDLSARFSLLVDTTDGSSAGLYLRNFDRKPGERAERLDYRLLHDPLRGPATFSLALIEERRADGRNVRLGTRESPWSFRLDETGLRPVVILEQRVADLVVTKRISAGAPEDVLSRDEDVLHEAMGDPEGSHHLDVRVSITNRGESGRLLHYRLHGPCAIDTENIRSPGYDIEFGYGVWGGTGRLISEDLTPDDLPEEGWGPRPDVAWLGLKNSYFLSALFPRHAVPRRAAPFVDAGSASAFPDPQAVLELAAGDGLGRLPLSDARYRQLAPDARENVRTVFSSVQVELARDATVEHRYSLVAAPRIDEVFERYEELELEAFNTYAWPGPLIRLFISLLDILKAVALGSWGAAIILLTFAVKLCLHPVNRRSQRSIMRAQKKMQKVKPLMDEIKERHSKDRLAQQREMQKLFQEHGINPIQQMGGCLMIFLQLPIWIGLYQTLQYAIGLRQAEFLWIDDLTRPDALFSLGFAIPFLGSNFNLLPVLYVILTVINQRLQPRPTDPQMQTQYRMMTFMMIFFGFIFYQFPAGFMLYIMTSAALGIVESKLIKAQLKREEEEGGETPPPPATTGKKPPGPAGPRPAPSGPAPYTVKRKRKKKGRK